MVRFLNRNWTRNSLLKSWTVFFDNNFSLAQIYKNRTQANCFRQKHVFLQILLKEKNTNKWRGCCSTSSIPPNLPPPPPPKKSPITRTTKRHPWCFYLIKQKSNNGYLFQSTSNLNGPKTQSWSAIRKLANQYQLGNSFLPLNFYNCSYEIYVNHWKESQHLAPWMLKIIQIPMNCNQEFTV